MSKGGPRAALGRLHSGTNRSASVAPPHARATPAATKPRRRHRAAPRSSCELGHLFDTFGSDKKRVHNYQRAYCLLFAPLRHKVRTLVELGFFAGAGSAAFATFFPNAEVYGIDAGDDFNLTSVPAGGKSSRLVPGHDGQALELGERAEHVHVFALQQNDLNHANFGAQRELGRDGVGLPSAGIDIVVDDADHFKTTQLHNLDVWLPRLRPGGLYIIEDIFVTPTPWAGWDTEGNRVPSNNTDCGYECFFVQRPADHPFVSAQPPAMRAALEGRDWFFTITGVHKGGGLDMMMVIVK